MATASWMSLLLGLGGGCEPDIVVDPLALDETILADATKTVPLTISNVGNSPLGWSITEEPGVTIAKVWTQSTRREVQNPTTPTFTGIPVASNKTSLESSNSYKGPLSVLYDQTNQIGTNGFPSQDFETSLNAYDNLGADDFTIPVEDGAWSIESLYILGSRTGALTVPLVNVFIYLDNGGLPGTAAYSAYGIVPTDVSGNLTIIFPSPAILPAGNYWLSVQAAMDFGTYYQWFWSTRAVQNADPYAWVNPGNGFGTGCTTWNSGASVCGVGGGVEPDALFRIEGTTIDVPWLSETPTSGTIPAGGSVEVQVTFDSTGLASGVYSAFLNISSNDPDEPTVVVPVTLRVGNFTYLPLLLKH